MAGAELLGERDRRRIKRLQGRFAIGHRAAIDAESGGGEIVSEQQALDVYQRQHAADRAAGCGIQEMRAMAEAALDDPLPAGTVEEGRVGVAVDEAVPAFLRTVVECADPQVLGEGVHWALPLSR